MYNYYHFLINNHLYLKEKCNEIIKLLYYFFKNKKYVTIKKGRNKMIIKPRLIRLIVNGLGFTLFCVLIGFSPLLTKLLLSEKFTTSDLIFPSVMGLIGIIFTIVLCFRTKYTLTEKELIIRYLIKEKKYKFKDIEYIDDLYTKKKRTFVFYVYSSNKRIAIPSDKNNVLLKETMKRAERKLTRVEFIKRHTNAF